MQNSPAPWHYGIKRGHSAKFIYDAQGGEVADCDMPFNSADANTANMRLAAAAPELLADLERAIDILTQVYGADAFVKEARETINKAKGV